MTVERATTEHYEVQTLSEYLQTVMQIYGRHTETTSLIVFRGQTEEFQTSDGRLFLTPPIFRPSAPVPSAKAPKGLMDAILQYLQTYLLEGSDETTRLIFKKLCHGDLKDAWIGFSANPTIRSTIEGQFPRTELFAIIDILNNKVFWSSIAQHYGMPTALLDVTTNSKIALWFARHKYQECNPGSIVEYHPWTGPGYVYAMKIPSNHQFVIPLSTLFFGEASRPRRQQAALLSEFYYEPPMEPSQATLAHRLIARIVIGRKFEPDLCQELTIQNIFPGPDEDVLYKYLLTGCTWVRSFGHCEGQKVSGSPPRYRHTSFRPLVSQENLAYDQRWFTILFTGDDAQTSWEYAMNWTYMGSRLGIFNLFDKKGFNMLKVSLDEAYQLVRESESVYTIIFCDIGGALLRSGVIKKFLDLIRRERKIINPSYLNLCKDERWASTKPRELDLELSMGEVMKILRAITSAQEFAHQLRQADPNSEILKRFFESLKTPEMSSVS